MTESVKKNSLFSRFAMDDKKEEQGVWVDFGDGIKVKVRRFKSKASQDARKELEKPLTAEIRRGPLEEKVQEDLLIKQMAKAIIVDWKGVTDEDGEELDCDFESKYYILKQLPEFRDEIAAIALDRDAYKAGLDEEGEKNS